jgi:elongation factor P
MLYASDFRKGITFEINGEPHVVLDFQHVKPGKGAAFVRTKYKNILTGATREDAFNPSDKFENARIETKVMQYLYNDGELYYFMDQETYDQLPIHAAPIGDAIKFLKEEMICKVLSYKGEIFSVELPITVELVITECEPGVRGDTTNNANKYATLETGAVVKVPLFVNQGETIRVDTRTGEYLERA